MLIFNGVKLWRRECAERSEEHRHNFALLEIRLIEYILHFLTCKQSIQEHNRGIFLFLLPNC